MENAMNISRRQLYAAGEPLGECVSRQECGRRIMGSGGGGGNSKTVQEIPAELKPLANAYTNKAINLGNQSFQPYQGQRFADLNTTQNLGLGMVQDRALNGSATMNNAEGSLNQIIGGQSNPYLDAMVNKAQANVLGNANAAAARSGSFGNSGIAEQAARQMGDIATQMYGGQYQFDQGQRMQAIGMAPTFGNAAYQDAQQLLNAGQVMQDQQQQGMDFNYGQFQDAQNLPYKQLASMGGVFGSGLGGSSTTTNSGGK
jgi:hypothetical protein